MITLERVVYTAKTCTIGGREGGVSQSSDGHLEVRFSTPGGRGYGTNPEQMFAAGWSACFASFIKLEAARRKIVLPEDIAIDAEVALGPDHGALGLEVRLNVRIRGVERSVARTLVDAADKICPYSRATRGNIPVAINLM